MESATLCTDAKLAFGGMRNLFRDAKQTLAANVRRLMQHQLLSDRVLGVRTKIAHKTINNVSNGRHNIQLDKLEKIAIGLGAIRQAAARVVRRAPASL